jgi:HSP20 family molecular chaperone IbpA
MKYQNLSKLILAFMFMASFFLSHASFADEISDLKNQLYSLEKRVANLEKDSALLHAKEDITEDQDSYLIKLNIPNLNKEHLEVSFKNGMLVVLGDQISASNQTAKRFSRTIPLPEDALKQDIEARYEDGVLTIKVPRTSAANATAADGVKIVVK